MQGQAVAALERRLAAHVGRKHSVAVNSSTDALYFALLAAGIGQGDEVLRHRFFVYRFRFVHPADGSTPVFVDIDETYNTNLDLAEARVTKKTRAIIFVHLYGQMGDPAKIEAFARAHNLILIEDAAQAIGATFNGRKAGSLGQVSCLSFNSTKTVSAPGGGGMVLTDDDVLAEGIRRQRYHGRASGGQFAVLGHNSLMPTLTAAVLNSELDHDAEWLARRRQIARHYRERLADIDAGLMLPIESAGAIHNYHKFVVSRPGVTRCGSTSSSGVLRRRCIILSPYTVSRVSPATAIRTRNTPTRCDLRRPW